MVACGRNSEATTYIIPIFQHASLTSKYNCFIPRGTSEVSQHTSCAAHLSCFSGQPSTRGQMLPWTPNAQKESKVSLGLLKGTHPQPTFAKASFQQRPRQSQQRHEQFQPRSQRRPHSLRVQSTPALCSPYEYRASGDNDNNSGRGAEHI